MNEAIRSIFLKNFGNRIKIRRKEKGISQEELANIVGYISENARSSIQKIESGKSDIPISKIKLIADALDTTPSYLMGWTDEENIIGEVKSSVLPDSSDLVTIYENLNDEGKRRLIEYAYDLSEVTKYKKESEIKHAYRVAHTKEGKEPSSGEIISISDEMLEKLRNAPESDIE